MASDGSSIGNGGGGISQHDLATTLHQAIITQDLVRQSELLKQLTRFIQAQPQSITVSPIS
jgi:hypothetical protein